MMQKKIRLRQRFENLEKAFLQFQEAVKNFDHLSDLEKEGLVKRFEYTFELTWKTLKDYLESEGVSVSFPREVFKTAFHHGILSSGEIWLDMLNLRNTLVHKYDEADFRSAVQAVVFEYYPEIERLYRWMKQKMQHSD